MSTVTGKVQEIEEKETSRGDTYYRVKLAGKWYGLWEGEPPDEGESITAEWSTSKDGKYLNIQGWSPAGKAAPETKPTSISPDAFEAKDRRIAMESAYSSAARVLAAMLVKGLDVGSHELHLLARQVFENVQAAGAGTPCPWPRAKSDGKPAVPEAGNADA
jgi:hypothetical protein